MEEEKKLARERAAIILQVRSGALTATEGAERLGISRKTYYEWEDRALQAMALALENHAPGRPRVPPDAEKEELQSKVRDLEKRLYLAEKTIKAKEVLSPYDLHEAKKTGRKSRRTGRGNPESDGDHRGDKRENRDALWDDLPGDEDSIGDLGPVAEEEEGESSPPQSPGAEEGGAVRSLHVGGGDPVAEPWHKAK